MSENLELAKCLIAALWADGEAKAAEWAQFSNATAELALSQNDIAELRAWGTTPRTLDDIDPLRLNADARKSALRLAFFMIASDHAGGHAERDFLPALCARLGIDEADSKAIMRDAALELKEERQR